MIAAFLADDLAGHLLTLFWLLVVIWVYKMVDCGHVGKRPLCRSQINSKNARVSQTIDRKSSWLAGERDRSVVSTVLSAAISHFALFIVPVFVLIFNRKY